MLQLLQTVNTDVSITAGLFRHKNKPGDMLHNTETSRSTNILLPIPDNKPNFKTARLE